MSILFAIPTLYEPQRRKIIHQCIDTLIQQINESGIQCKVVILSAQDSEKISLRYTDNTNVLVLANRNRHNLPATLNIAIKHNDNCKYFAYIHDDIIIHDPRWMDICIQVSEMKDLRSGILGLRQHRGGATFISHQLVTLSDRSTMTLEEHTWTDGLLWLTMDNVNAIGHFDENYQCDCDTEDYGYRARVHGLRNYILPLTFDHFNKNFYWKTGFFSGKKLIILVNESREYHRLKWSNKEKITLGQLSVEPIETRTMQIIYGLFQRKIKKILNKWVNANV